MLPTTITSAGGSFVAEWQPAEGKEPHNISGHGTLKGTMPYLIQFPDK